MSVGFTTNFWAEKFGARRVIYEIKKSKKSTFSEPKVLEDLKFQRSTSKVQNDEEKDIPVVDPVW